MADQCIVCLENLDVEPAHAAPLFPSAGNSTSPCQTAEGGATPTTSGNEALCCHAADEPHHDEAQGYVAQIEICNHFLHDACLREWSSKANSCPICRQLFHKVHVYDKVGGTRISSYEVSDRKQVQEFDVQQWLAENPEDQEEPSRPCPVCNRDDREDVLLLCDICDTPYHTYCIGLNAVPSGHWFCIECTASHGPEIEDHVHTPEQLNGDDGHNSEEEEEDEPPRAARSNTRGTHFFPRTRASMRRARRRAFSDEWQGAWGQVAGRVFNALDLDLDLDFQDDDEEYAAWQGYRRSQQLRQRELREHELWQQRLNIASRLGARDVFRDNMPGPGNSFANLRVPARRSPAPETREERRAWGALERARESEGIINGTVPKRKSRSSTAEPDPQEEPERKLKRPRTRRLPAQNGQSSSLKSAAPPSATSGSQNALPAAASTTVVVRSSPAAPPSIAAASPSFLSSLLREVETSTSLEGEGDRDFLVPFSGGYDASSPATSPSPSGHSSPPRASSSTPPPTFQNSRPSSPCPLSSVVEPMYPPANYSPSRASRQRRGSPQSSPETSDSESRQRNDSPNLRQPRPRRPQSINLSRAEDHSPARSALSLETKESINRLVRDALRPHWKTSKLTAEQYANINRDVSRKLYDVMKDPSSIDDAVRRSWEQMADREVTRAVSEMKI